MQPSSVHRSSKAQNLWHLRSIECRGIVDLGWQIIIPAWSFFVPTQSSSFRLPRLAVSSGPLSAAFGARTTGVVGSCARLCSVVLARCRAGDARRWCTDPGLQGGSPANAEEYSAHSRVPSAHNRICAGSTVLSTCLTGSRCRVLPPRAFTGTNSSREGAACAAATPIGPAGATDGLRRASAPAGRWPSAAPVRSPIRATCSLADSATASACCATWASRASAAGPCCVCVALSPAGPRRSARCVRGEACGTSGVGGGLGTAPASFALLAVELRAEHLHRPPRSVMSMGLRAAVVRLRAAQRGWTPAGYLAKIGIGT